MWWRKRLILTVIYSSNKNINNSNVNKKYTYDRIDNYNGHIKKLYNWDEKMQIIRFMQRKRMTIITIVVVVVVVRLSVIVRTLIANIPITRLTVTVIIIWSIKTVMTIMQIIRFVMNRNS